MADKYSIPTYNAVEIIRNAKVKQDQEGNGGFYYSIDYRNKRERRRYIKATCRYGDTALFYQLRKVLSEKGVELRVNNDGDTDLGCYIIFVDFEKLFDKADNEEKLKDLFKHGLEIKYENETVQYFPYEKSNSMARQSKMSFINAELRDDLNKRLNLDINFPTLQLSKYYAYKGLYLSTAERIDTPEIILNSEKIVIIDDPATERIDKVITGEADDSSGKNKWKISEITKKIEIKVFDGEGLISPEWSDIINHYFESSDKNLYNKKYRNASSYQVRMPFAKGMLHRVDFKAYIKEFTDAGESFIIKDAFGIERDLFKAEIIMPVSMFKCRKWIGDNIEAYFEALKKYDHAIYISQTDLVYGNSKCTTLNYQILNTLDLTVEEFESLIEDHNKMIRDPLSYYEGPEEYDDTETEEDGDNDGISDCGERNRKFALKLNPVFSHERSIQSALDMLSKKTRKDLAMGKINVEGEIRYLSRDLNSFMIDLLEKGGADINIIRQLKSTCMFEDEFFLPQNQIGLEISWHYPVFRNPHLSRNEQCALKPYFVGKEKRKKDIYYRYFGHLKGIVMVAYNSLAPMALGGADFDGDTVRIINDSRVRNAVLRGVYCRNQEKGRVYIRKLPVVDIPSVKVNEANQQNVGKEISFDVIKNTFSNKIGVLSNLSVRIGRKQYADNAFETAHTCAECTILTGLEIDAAKHGVHPCLDDICKDSNAKAETDYINFKEFIENNDLFITCKNVHHSDNELKISVGKNPKNSITIKINDDLRGLDRLPLFYYDALKIKMELPGEKVGNKYIYFDFLLDNNWKNDLDKEKAAKLKAVMSAFNKIAKKHSSSSRVRKRLKESNFEGHFRTILDIQYDNDKRDDIWGSDYENICGTVERTLDTPQKLQNALESLKSGLWIYLYSDDEKKEYLKSIFGEEPDDNVADILTNFSFSGYKLLYYAIIDELSMRADDYSAEELDYTDNSDDELSVDTDMEYYNEIYNRLDSKYKECETNRKEYWKDEIMKICNDAISTICSDMNEYDKLKLLWSLRGKEKSNSDFFWINVSRESLERHCIKEGENNA